MYEAQYDKIVKEDSTSKVGLSYVGRKLMKLFPSAKVEALTNEDSMKIWNMPTTERMLLAKQKVQMDLAKTAGLDLKAQFLNSSQWHVNDSIQPKAKRFFMQTAQSILVRESMIVKIDELCEEIEKIYYEYVVLKLQATALDIPMNSEQLFSKENQSPLLTHKKLRVAFACYRTYTLTIAENISSMRSMCRKEVAIRDVEILITWYGVNYAKKMQTDVQHWYKYSILRFWLPFEPNLFMLPPNQIDGSGEDGGCHALLRRLLIHF